MHAKQVDASRPLALHALRVALERNRKGFRALSLCLESRALQLWQEPPLVYSSERPNQRSTHSIGCPCQPAPRWMAFFSHGKLKASQRRD